LEADPLFVFLISQQEFSFSMPNVDIIIDDVRVRGVGKSFDSLGDSVFTEVKRLNFKAAGREPSAHTEDGTQQSKCAEKASVYYEEKGRVEVPVFLLERLEAGDLIEGPGALSSLCFVFSSDVG
jgi:5-oxoprolinase (ATP-hydrolysing)